MTHPHRILRALAAAAAVTVLVAGPVSATESGGSEGSPAATEAPAGEAGAEGGAEGEGAAEGEGEGGHTKIQPPLGFDEPKELVGWGFLMLTGLAGLVAAYHMLKQLKGTRPQADGSWRPR